MIECNEKQWKTKQNKWTVVIIIIFFTIKEGEKGK